MSGSPLQNQEDNFRSGCPKRQSMSHQTVLFRTTHARMNMYDLRTFDMTAGFKPFTAYNSI